MPLPVAAVAIPAAISAVSSLAGGILGNKSAAASTQQMIDFARENRDYNTPVKQRKRLEQAGFNPMTYGQNAQVQAAAQTPNIPADYSMRDAVTSIGSTFSQALNDAVQRDYVSANSEYQRHKMIVDLDEQRRKWTETFDQNETNSLARKIAKKNLEWIDREKQSLINNQDAQRSLYNAQENLERERLVTEHITQQIQKLQIPLTQSAIASNYAQVKSALAQSYAAYAAGNESKARALLVNSQKLTEDELRRSRVGTSKAQHAYMNVVYSNAADELRLQRSNAWHMGDPRNFDIRTWNEWMKMAGRMFNTLNPFAPLRDVSDAAGDAAGAAAKLIK